MDTYTSPQDGTTLDTFSTPYAPTTNYSTNASLFVGYDSASSRLFRTWIDFPVFGGGSIPPGAVVISAKLYLKIASDDSGVARTVRVFRCKRDMVISQATWNIYSTGNSWATAGGFGANDCEQTDIGNLAFTASEAVGSWKEFVLTASAIQDMLNGTWATSALLIKTDGESNDRYGYYSTEYATPEDRPYIAIEYFYGGVTGVFLSDGFGFM